MRRLDSLFALVLLSSTGLILLIGEMTGPGLSIFRNLISEFAARLDSSGAMVRLAMWGFGLSYLATAAVLIRWQGNSIWVRWGCLCLAAAASLLPFVAEFRILFQAQGGGILERWFPKDPADWEKFRQAAHGMVITASNMWVMGGIILVGIGGYRSSTAVLSKWSLRCVVSAGAFLWMTRVPQVKGLMELLAFGSIAVWLVIAIRSTTGESVASDTARQ